MLTYRRVDWDAQAGEKGPQCVAGPSYEVGGTSANRHDHLVRAPPAAVTPSRLLCCIDLLQWGVPVSGQARFVICF